MTFFLIAAVAFLAAALTFFSGFGLGTLLLPAFALFVPLEQAVALTAVVHLLNNLFKLLLVGRKASGAVVVRFGLPAIVASFAGAWLLVRLGGVAPLFGYVAFGRRFEVTPIGAALGAVLLVFALLELSPRFRALSFAPRWMPLGGLASGFFGGLSGMQGALRSAFLLRAGLGKEAFLGTGVAIACLVDLVRLAVYSGPIASGIDRSNLGLLATAVVAALGGALLGNRYLAKTTWPAIQRIVVLLLALFALALLTGLMRPGG
jgi:uncharacterized membrane protein YfcA